MDKQTLNVDTFLYAMRFLQRCVPGSDFLIEREPIIYKEKKILQSDYDKVSSLFSQYKNCIFKKVFREK